jgi:predicted hotdog family 3-hydroxylacyl-ACP dehydratase
MSLLDRVQAVEDDSLVATVEIREGIPFFAGCAVPAWVGLEYMAQAIAALAGARARREGRPIPLGLLIGCRKFVTRVAMFAVGTRLAVEVRELVSDGAGLGAFACTIYAVGSGDAGEDGDLVQDAEVLVESQLTVYGGQPNV